MKVIKLITYVFFYSGLAFSQGLKNADFSDQTAAETGTLKDGIPVNYFNVEGVMQRALAGKEFPYYKAVITDVINGVDNGWINSPSWKRKFEWRYDEALANGVYRTKEDDEKNYPNRFVISNIFQPAKEHPLYQYFLNKNDSLYQPMKEVDNPRSYIIKVQDYENNSPRLAVKIHINNLFKTNSISEIKELDWQIKTKTPYKIYQYNDSIWFKNEDFNDRDATDMRFQKNTVYVVLGSHKDLDFSKGMSDGFQEYRIITYPNKEATHLMRVDHVIIELTGHPQSIKLFFDKIDWKLIDKAFKTKIK